MTTKKSTQYTVEALDIDMDGVPDGDLVTQWKNGVVTKRKFVPYDKLEKVAENALETNANTNTNAGAKQRIVYKRMPDMKNSAQPVVVQDGTKFGQYVKMGAGVAVGQIAVQSVWNGLTGLFSE